VKTRKFPWEKKGLKFFSPYLILFLFVVWGVINGFLHHNSLSNIFLDLNGWLFFLLILPLYDIFIVNERRKENWRFLEVIFLVGVWWLSLKTLFVSYIFCHQIVGVIPELYRWIRQSGVGEITFAGGGFWRIFLQSQIYLLLAVPFLLFKTRIWSGLKKQWFWYLTLVLAFSALIVSMSRSFWLGLLVSLLVVSIGIFFENGKKEKMKIKIMMLGANWLRWVVVIFFSFLLVFAFAKFPYPAVSGSFNMSLFMDRADLGSGESALSSRWELLDALQVKLANCFVLGEGYGTTVTYLSHDPRIQGAYTTYAFEWGWLDMWIKLGVLGVLAYIYLLGIIVKQSFVANKKDGLGAFIVLAMVVSLAVVHIFTPYLGHPLGIGAVLVLALLVQACIVQENEVY
jgi:hypothetical protein